MVDSADRPMTTLAASVGVLDKAVRLLELVASGPPASAAQLAGAAGMARPTAYRLLAALEGHRLLDRDADGRYRLGLRHLEWASAVTSEHRVIAVARPILLALRDDTGESVQLYLRQGDVRVCVLAAERPSGLRDTVPVGAALPLDRGSGGRVFLAFGADRLDRWEVDRAVLAGVREAGWAATVADREPGVASVSAPVLRPGGELAAVVSVSGPIDRLGADPGRLFSDRVRAAAREVAGAAFG
jgi:DNA-binding IclR family transcriptional regulator